MAGRWLGLLLLAPIAEILLLVAVGERIGGLQTFGLVVLAAAVGLFLARREGLAAWRRLQERMARGGSPGADLADGVIVLASAVLLIIPGFLSDAAALVGLFPATRALVRRSLLRRIERGVASGQIRVVTPTPMTRPDEAEPVEDAEVIDDGRRRGSLPPVR